METEGPGLGRRTLVLRIWFVNKLGEEKQPTGRASWRIHRLGKAEWLSR